MQQNAKFRQHSALHSVSVHQYTDEENRIVRGIKYESVDTSYRMEHMEYICG